MDSEFWAKHYSNFSDMSPSPFAQKCSKLLDKNDTLIELGCGNGRDGMHLASHCKSYIGYDVCEVATSSFLQNTDTLSGNMSVRTEDFSNVDFLKNGLADNARTVFYSRFSLHSISVEEEARLFQNIGSLGTSNWVFFLEARTVEDPLYGQGRQVGTNEFVTDHYRRFLDPKQFLLKIGGEFDVSYFETSAGFAPYGESDPIVLRAIFSGVKR